MMLWLFGQLISLAWKILTFTFIINVFITLVKNGKVTIKDMCDTAAGALRLWMRNIQKWLFIKYQESEKESKKEEPKTEP